VDGLWKLLTVVVAAVVAYVSWNQWRIARDRLRLDLFDKRYKVFDGARSMIGHVVTAGRLPMEVLHEYWAATTDRRFLFGDDVVAYLDDMDKHVAGYQTYSEASRRTRDPVERKKAIDIEYSELGWLSDELLKGGLQAKFAPYLQFGDVRRTARLLTKQQSLIIGALVALVLSAVADWRDWFPKPDYWSYRDVGGIRIEGDAPWCKVGLNDQSRAECRFLSEEHCQLNLLNATEWHPCMPNPLIAARLGDS
jgi:hypothetical protein